MSAKWVVYKYPLVDWLYSSGPRVTLDGPVLHVGLDPRGAECVWIAGDPDSETNRMLFIVGTGHLYDPRIGVHVGSVTAGEFVWHVFDDWAAAVESDRNPQ